MTYQEILFSSPEEGIALINLHRPKALNALTPTMIRELKHAIETVAVDSTFKVLILTGSGRAFSAGVDLKAMNDQIQGGQFSSDDLLKDGIEMIRTLQTMPQPTIAMVNGHCYTGAMELMLAFDLLIAANEASIADTHAKWGILPKWGMTQRLPLRVGLQKAMEISFTAQPISGEEAARIGLVNRAVPLENLMETTLQLARKIAANSRQTIGFMKSLYYFGANATLAEGLKNEFESNVPITDRSDFLKNFEKNKQ